MPTQIKRAVMSAAIKDYLKNNKTLREVAQSHGMNMETLRKALGSRVRPRGTRYLADGSVKTPGVKNGRKIRTSKSSELTPRSNKRWTPTEDELLRDAVLTGMTVSETVELLGRTAVSIYCRKCYLLDNGYIPDPETRFTLAKGIKRPRKVEDATIERIVEIDESREEEEKVPSAPVTQTTTINSIELEDLAKLVKSYGVNITVSVTSSGTEVKMHS
jgi:DNA-binding transcriptional regulator YhcF (GntR family)